MSGMAWQPWPGKGEGEVNPKPKICCGRYISRTHCHRDAAVESASEERQLRGRERERDGERQSCLALSNWNVVSAGVRIFHCQFLGTSRGTLWHGRERRGRGTNRVGRSCQGLPYFCHISREPTQMSHQSCDQCCVRSKENIHFALAPKNESTFALDPGLRPSLVPLLLYRSSCCMRND